MLGESRTFGGNGGTQAQGVTGSEGRKDQASSSSEKGSTANASEPKKHATGGGPYDAGDDYGRGFHTGEEGVEAHSSQTLISSPPEPPTAEEIRKKIADVALRFVDSENWAYDSVRGPYGEGTNKCNLFVHEVLAEAGVIMPMENGGVLYNLFGVGDAKYPLLAGQWGGILNTISLVGL